VQEKVDEITISCRNGVKTAAKYVNMRKYAARERAGRRRRKETALFLPKSKKTGAASRRL